MIPMKNSLTENIDEKKYIILIIYDIVENKTRSKMVKLLNRYGVRVQKSAFEANLTRKQYGRLLQEAPKCIDPQTDSLRIYILSNYLAVSTWGVGLTNTDDVIII